MKKNFLLSFIYIVCYFVFFANSVFADGIEKVVILTSGRAENGYGYSSQPEIINLIVSDIYNELNSNSYIEPFTNRYLIRMINSEGIYQDYIDFLKSYKNSYSIDYNFCSLLAEKTHANKILIVSGDFDMQNMSFKKNMFEKLEINQFGETNPSYKLNIIVTLIDHQNGNILWEKNYNKYFISTNFGMPSPFFEKSEIPVSKVKVFSQKVSKSINSEINKLYGGSEVTSVKSNIIKTVNNLKNKSKITKQRQNTVSTSKKYNLNKAKSEDYKQWILDTEK